LENLKRWEDRCTQLQKENDYLKRYKARCTHLEQEKDTEHVKVGIVKHVKVGIVTQVKSFVTPH
jgi:hypothetical protein